MQGTHLHILWFKNQICILYSLCFWIPYYLSPHTFSSKLIWHLQVQLIFLLSSTCDLLHIFPKFIHNTSPIHSRLFHLQFMRITIDSIMLRNLDWIPIPYVFIASTYMNNISILSTRISMLVNYDNLMIEVYYSMNLQLNMHIST